jgi:DinB superfamily
MELKSAVERFCRLAVSLTDADLERPWTWGDYDEGVRFAFFRTYESLRDLAVTLANERRKTGLPQTPAQHILAQYQSAFSDMEAVLVGVTDEQALLLPSEGEWSLRTVLRHFVEAEGTFFAITNYALERARAQDGRPLALPDADWDAFWAGDPYEAMAESGSFSEILAYFRGLHARVLEAFAGISEAELDEPVVFWESRPMPVRFRLHRFESHLRQHTIQMDKALVSLGLAIGEARRLVRMVYSSLAEVQGWLIGAGELGSNACADLAAEIDLRTDEIEGTLQ